LFSMHALHLPSMAAINCEREGEHTTHEFSIGQGVCPPQHMQFRSGVIPLRCPMTICMVVAHRVITSAIPRTRTDGSRPQLSHRKLLWQSLTLTCTADITVFSPSCAVQMCGVQVACCIGLLHDASRLAFEISFPTVAPLTSMWGAHLRCFDILCSNVKCGGLVSTSLCVAPKRSFLKHCQPTVCEECLYMRNTPSRELGYNSEICFARSFDFLCSTLRWRWLASPLAQHIRSNMVDRIQSASVPGSGANLSLC
jgi:hypothetical protein